MDAWVLVVRNPGRPPCADALLAQALEPVAAVAPVRAALQGVTNARSALNEEKHSPDANGHAGAEPAVISGRPFLNARELAGGSG